MIEITDGVRRLTVTGGAFREIYKRQGFVKVSEYVALVERVGGQVQSAETEDLELFAQTIEEKPISKWTNAQMAKYASYKGIDLTGAKNARERRNRIKAYWDLVESQKVEEEESNDEKFDDSDWDVD